MTSISIIIRAYNEEAHIGRLLKGITQQTVSDAEIILVDSGSTDSTVEIARGYGARIVSIKPEDFTFGYSLNQGIAAAAGEIIVIASAHVYPVFPDWLERLTAPFKDPKIGVAYGKQRGMETTKYSEHQVFARWFPDTSNPRQVHAFSNNANAAIRKKLWLKNPYDEKLTGLEDLAWAKWVLQNGYLVSYVAEAEIIHIHDEVPRQVYNRYRREAMAFKQIFDEAHFSLYDFFRMTWSNIITDLWHALRERKLRGNFTSIFWFRTLQFWGTFRGYRQANQPLTAPLRQTFYYPRGRDIEAVKDREIDPIRYNDEQ